MPGDGSGPSFSGWTRWPLFNVCGDSVSTGRGLAQSRWAGWEQSRTGHQSPDAVKSPLGSGKSAFPGGDSDSTFLPRPLRSWPCRLFPSVADLQPPGLCTCCSVFPSLPVTGPHPPGPAVLRRSACRADPGLSAAGFPSSSAVPRVRPLLLSHLPPRLTWKDSRPCGCQHPLCGTTGPHVDGPGSWGPSHTG